MTNRARPDLLSDIGGTHARFALGYPDDSFGDVRVLDCDDFPDLPSALETYLAGVAPKARPVRAAIAVAGPDAGETVTLTNRAWSFTRDKVRNAFGFETVVVSNDFAAVAAAIPFLADGDREQVGGGFAVAYAPVAVLGAGTGLGVSYLVPVRDGRIPFATEGGNVTLAPADDRESEVLNRMRERFGHVSAERALSGPGLVNLYEALAAVDTVAPIHSSPEAVAALGLTRADPLCDEALTMFCAMLGTVASNLALSVDARGGVYIAGGIVPSLGPRFAQSGFRARFENKGRFSAYLGAIPTYVVVHPYPAFVGLRALLDAEEKGGTICRT